ncbi:conserved hypothetical protein [Vibrio phage 424E50-1]|nr:conserved hypothetical protein [Vibrio phage 424E50-1]CAH9012824.1 conserved hypothetical protein [Vibrio phage 501E54-1]
MDIPWDLNWEKSYKVSIGTRPYIPEQYTAQELQAIPTSLQRPASSYEADTIPSNAVKLGNLVSEGFDRRGFSFKFNYFNKLSKKGGDAENATLDLYNPSEELVDIIMQDRAVVVLELGYQQKVELEYSGDIVKVSSREVGSDTIYTIKCASGALAMRNTLVNLHYSETVSEQDVILDMIGRFPSTAVGTYGLNDLNGRFRTGGRNFTGSLVTNFDNLMAKHNLSYAHLNNKIVLVPYRLLGEDYDNFARTNFTLDLHSIKKITDVTKKGDIGSKDVNSKLRSLQVNTFYAPIELGQFITIPDSEYTSEYAGTYQVKAKRTIAESTPNGGWDIVLEVESLSQ